jgi:hypothetical protein
LSPTHSGWVSLGPGNIGGRTRAIVIHPTTPAVMWAGSAGGGLAHRRRRRFLATGQRLPGEPGHHLAGHRSDQPQNRLRRDRRRLFQSRCAARRGHLPHNGRRELAGAARRQRRQLPIRQPPGHCALTIKFHTKGRLSC